MIRSLIGLEFGSSKSLISKVGRTGLESIDSETSNREIPTLVGFDENERTFAEHCYSSIKRNYKNTINMPQRFLSSGIQLSVEDLALLFASSVCYYNIEHSEIQYQQQENISQHNFCCFCINNKYRLLPQQIVAAYLTYIDSIITIRKVTEYAAVVSIPSYFTLAERRALDDSCIISDFKALRLIDEHVAIAYAYLWQFKKQLHEMSIQQQQQDVNVLFIDIGYSKTNIFAVSFKYRQAKIQMVQCHRSLGVKNIDLALFQYIEQKRPVLKNVYGNGSQENDQISSTLLKGKKKSFIRVLEAIEKLRHQLSMNSEGHLSVECITEDQQDLDISLTREEYENLIINKFLSSLKNELERAKLTLNEIKFRIDDVELMGGGTRIPSVKKIIQDLFSLKLNQMMSLESISRGCALQAAVLLKDVNQIIKIENYEVINCMTHTYTFQLVKKLDRKVSADKMDIEFPENSKHQEKILAQNSNQELILATQIIKSNTIIPTILELKSNSKDNITIQDILNENLIIKTYISQGGICENVLHIVAKLNINEQMRKQLQQQLENSSTIEQLSVPVKIDECSQLKFFVLTLILNIKVKSRSNSTNQQEQQNQNQSQQQQGTTDMDVEYTNQSQTQNLSQQQTQQNQYQQQLLNQTNVIKLQIPITFQQLSGNLKCYCGQSDHDMDDVIKEEDKSRKIDKEFRARKDVFNNLEKFILEQRHLLEEHGKIIYQNDEKQYTNFQGVLTQAQQWLEEQGGQATSSILLEKLQNLEKIFQVFVKEVNQLKYQAQSIQVHNVKELKAIANQYKNKPIQGLDLLFHNQNIGDGRTGIVFGLFKSGASSLADLILQLNVLIHFSIQLGNNGLTDNGLQIILNAIQKSMGTKIKEFALDLENMQGEKNINNITNVGLQYIFQGIEKMSELQSFDLCLHSIDYLTLTTLYQSLVSNKNIKLKQLKIQIKRGGLSISERSNFVNLINNIPQIQAFEFAYFNEKGEQEPIVPIDAEIEENNEDKINEELQKQNQNFQQ